MNTNKGLWEARHNAGIDKDKLARKVAAGEQTHTLDNAGSEPTAVKKGSSKGKSKETAVADADGE